MTEENENLKKIQEMFPHGHPDFYRIMFDLMDLHNRKNHDYASDENPLSNFNRVGFLAGLYDVWNWKVSHALKVAVIFKLKQFDAFMNLLQQNKEALVEGVPERLKDVAVYSVLEMILFEESQQMPRLTADQITSNSLMKPLCGPDPECEKCTADVDCGGKQ